MAREQTIHCDRCKSVVAGNGSILKVEAGLLRGTVGHWLPESMDFCTDCAAAFLDWFRAESKKQP